MFKSLLNTALDTKYDKWEGGGGTNTKLQKIAAKEENK
jgi:hypothetical protein